MSGNSLVSLLARMKEGSVTQGWGAVSVFSRSRLNRLLEQQYIERFNGYGFIPAFAGSVSLNEERHEYVDLQAIALGQPLLSFNTASLNNSTAVLTMNIIGGRYNASRQPPGATTTLLSSFNITEQQGFKLEMDIDLSLVVGEIDKRGKVKLDLADGVNFRCNLAGDDETINKLFADFFKQHFATLPAHRGVFQLGILDLKGYNHLTPRSFRIATQAAPGAKIKGALNYGDGGVVVLIRLRGNETDGRYPPDSTFPYLIPDDREPDGSDRYSASLVLSEAMIPHINDSQLDVLNSLLFPGENIFEERNRETPRDLAVFGNISAKQTRISLEPAFKTIKAGETQRFKLLDWKGQEIQAAKWSAISLQSHTPEGHGTITNGLYTAASKARIGHDSLHVVVTAEYVREGTTYTASALLLVAFDEMTVAPRVAVYAARLQTDPIVLTASTTNDVALNWSLLAPEYGVLTQNARQALFTPDARARIKGLVVQRVQASGGDKHEASLVLVNSQQMLRIAPAYVPSLTASSTVQLKDDVSLLPGVPRRWKVIGGGGTVDATGLFTAPAQGITSTSVVQCEIVRNGVILSSGHSIIGQSEMAAEPTWKNLTQFTIKVPGGLDDGRLGSLFGNGYQQLRVEVVVETAPVGEDNDRYPLSVQELASMTLVHDASQANMPYVDAALEGIPHNDRSLWRARLISNRFELAFPRVAAQDYSPSNDAISKKELYIHSRERANSTTVFHAAFQQDSGDNKWWRSADRPEKNNKIEVTPLAIPVFTNEDYSFTRERVEGGSGAPPVGPENDDDFDFHLITLDYWKLQYTGSAALPGVTFDTLEFLDTGDPGIYMSPSTSTIRWESEQLAETMFSWTGYIFQDSLATPMVKKIQLDQSIKNIVLSEELLDKDVDMKHFATGMLVISLHRHNRVNYVRSGERARDKLSRSVAVELIDSRGNRHLRQFNFLPPSVLGHRNRVVHTLFTPPIEDH